ncbi:protein FAM186B [Tenrec ecaudatus]|uniref:protein FAM186B n=1 Tax=Tenrec ecaudatus TaxID=94439 RepID=UPI003F5AAF8C
MDEEDSPQLATPDSVKAIISRIEAAQLTRAQEDISTQLSGILDNVNCVISRFQEELGYDLKEKAKSQQTEQRGHNRFILLEKIASFSKDAKTKEKHLYELLCWLADWGDSLTFEIRNRKSEEEEEALDEWIEVMEKVLPLSLMATKGGIESLISLCSTLIEEQKKKTQMSKRTLWQGWQEKSPQTSPPEPQPPSPEQMLQDKQTTCTRVSEVRSMLQELLDSATFNKGEVQAIRYMSAVVENLHKALLLQHQENMSLETKYRHLKLEMTRELSSQRLYFQKALSILENKRDTLLKQVDELGRKYHDLLLIQHALELQLKKAQQAGGHAGGSRGKALVDSTDLLERERFETPENPTEPPTRALVAPPEPDQEEQLFRVLSPSPAATAWAGDEPLSVCPPLTRLATQSRIADRYCDQDSGEKSLLPASPPSVVGELPKPRGSPAAAGPAHPEEEQKEEEEEEEEEAEETGGLRVKIRFRKKPSPESEARSCEEEELGWAQPRRPKRWAQPRPGQLRQGRRDKALSSKPGRPAREGAEGVPIPASRGWKERERAESPSTRGHSTRAAPGSGPPGASSAQSASRSGRTLRSAESLRSRTPGASARPRKSSSFPIPERPARRGPRVALQTSLVAHKEKYWMGMEAQRKNLELLSGAAELGLPNSLRSKALELTTTTMQLSALRLPCLCGKYVTYRHFRRLRQEVIDHIQSLRVTGVSYQPQSLNVFLRNLDRLRNLRLQAWTNQEKELEEKHRECLSSMATMFPKLQLEWNVHLNTPMVTSSKSRKSKSPPAFSRRVHSSSQEHLMSKPRECVPLRMARQQGSQMEPVWKTDLASSSHPIEKKTPSCLSWDQLGGHPDIPRLLVMDVHSSYHKSLITLKSRAVTTLRKEESSHEPAELVRRKSSESLLEAPGKPEAPDSASPRSIP